MRLAWQKKFINMDDISLTTVTIRTPKPNTLETSTSPEPRSVTVLKVGSTSKTAQLSVHIAPSSLHTTVLTVTLRLVERLVQPLRPPLHQPTEKYRAQAAEKDQTSSESVVRLMLGREEVWREPVRALAHAVRDGDESCLLAAWRGDQSRLPRELQVETVVGAADQQARSEVPGGDARGRDHDRDADGRCYDRDDDVVARLSELAGTPSESAGAGVGNGVWRSLDEICVELGEAKGLDDLRQC